MLFIARAVAFKIGGGLQMGLGSVLNDTHIRQFSLTNTMSRFDARAGCFRSELLSAGFISEGPDSE